MKDFQFTRSFGRAYAGVDKPLSAVESFRRATEDAEHNHPRFGESSTAEWLRAISYGIAALLEERDV